MALRHLTEATGLNRGIAYVGMPRARLRPITSTIPTDIIQLSYPRLRDAHERETPILDTTFDGPRRAPAVLQQPPA